MTYFIVNPLLSHLGAYLFQTHLRGECYSLHLRIGARYLQLATHNFQLATSNSQLHDPHSTHTLKNKVGGEWGLRRAEGEEKAGLKETEG